MERARALLGDTPHSDDCRYIMAVRDGDEDARYVDCTCDRPIRATLAFAQQPEGWRPIQTAPADEPFIAGLWVTNNQTGARWWEWYVVAIDDETGEARGYPDGEPLPWSLADFEAWHPVPAPPAAMLDVAPIPGEE